MKRFILITIFVFCSISVVFADVYVTYDKSSKDVIDVSKREDVVLQNGWERIKLQGKLTDYPLQYAPIYYKYENDRFVVNINKLSDEAIAQQDAETYVNEMSKIQKKAYLMAKKELEKDGLVFTKVKDSDFDTGGV